jgi:hypothetical protein
LRKNIYRRNCNNNIFYLQLIIYCNCDTIKKSDKLLSRQRLYKQHWQTIWIIVENKNKHALMTKQFIWSLSCSLLLQRNNIIVTKKQYKFFGNMLVKTQISEHLATYCNKALIHCNNINNKIDQIYIFYCNSDTIKLIS